MRSSMFAATVAGVATVAGALTGVTANGDSPSGAHRAGPARPNIVLIVMDDLRRDDLPWLPTVRREIKRTGTRFANFYAPTPLCCPARASILRGQYAHNTGVLTNAEPDGGFAGFAGRDGSTLASWLDPTYATGYVGKYLNGYAGDRAYVPPGWDDWNATVRTYDYLDILLSENGTLVDESGVNSPAVFARHSVEFVRERAPRREPFFLQLSLVTPHSGGPHGDGDGGRLSAYVPPRDRGRYAGPAHSRGPAFNEKHVGDKTGPVADLPRLTRVNRANIAMRNRQRREALASADRAIRRLLQEIDASGERGNTFVVFTSDNGFMLGEHRIPNGKGSPYRDSSAVPLLISGPGVPAHNVWTSPAAAHDIAPTILDMAGVWAGIAVDGRTVLPSRQRPHGPDHRAILLEFADLPTDPENDGKIRYAAPRPVAETGWRYRAVVTKGWKLVQWYPSSPRRRAWELYDLRHDPHEVANLAGQADTRHRARALKRRLAVLWLCAGRECR